MSSSASSILAPKTDVSDSKNVFIFDDFDNNLDTTLP